MTEKAPDGANYDYKTWLEAQPRAPLAADISLAENQTTVPSDRVWPVSIARNVQDD